MVECFTRESAGPSTGALLRRVAWPQPARVHKTSPPSLLNCTTIHTFTTHSLLLLNSSMAELAGQISSAIQIALNPASSQQDRDGAYQFAQQVKEAGAQTAPACLELFLQGGRWGAQERMFGAQVVGERYVQPSTGAGLNAEFSFSLVQLGTAQPGDAAVRTAVIDKLLRSRVRSRQRRVWSNLQVPSQSLSQNLLGEQQLTSTSLVPLAHAQS